MQMFYFINCAVRVMLCNVQSSCKVPAIVGIVRIAREAYPCRHQFDSSSKYYDPKRCAAGSHGAAVHVRLW
jgi:predicted RNA-binding protein with PUA-like domain